MDNQWYKIAFPLADTNMVGVAWNLVQLAGQIHNQLGSPKNFAIFSAMESNNEAERVDSVFYFSPVAAASCASILAPYSPVPCDKPVPHEMLALAFGTLQGSESWDLLK